MMRVEIELSMSGPNRTLAVAEAVASALTHALDTGTVVHRLIVEEADA